MGYEEQAAVIPNLIKERDKLKADLAKAVAALERIVKFCSGGDPCFGSEDRHCRIYEHEVARATLAELKRREK